MGDSVSDFPRLRRPDGSGRCWLGSPDVPPLGFASVLSWLDGAHAFWGGTTEHTPLVITSNRGGAAVNVAYCCAADLGHLAEALVARCVH